MRFKVNNFNSIIRYLIQCRRQQLQIDREALKKAKALTEYQKLKIAQELQELRELELEIGVKF